MLKLFFSVKLFLIFQYCHCNRYYNRSQFSRTHQHEDIYLWENKSLVISSQCGKVVHSVLRRAFSESLCPSQKFPDIRCSARFQRMESNTSHVGRKNKFFDSSWVSSKWPSSSVVEVPEPMLPRKIHHVILFASEDDLHMVQSPLIMTCSIVAWLPPAQ